MIQRQPLEGGGGHLRRHQLHRPGDLDDFLPERRHAQQQSGVRHGVMALRLIPDRLQGVLCCSFCLHPCMLLGWNARPPNEPKLCMRRAAELLPALFHTIGASAHLSEFVGKCLRAPEQPS